MSLNFRIEFWSIIFCQKEDSVYDKNFITQGGKLFNILPKEIRQQIGTNKIDSIKEMLDKYLKKIPYQPSCAKIQKVSKSNSIIDQINTQIRNTYWYTKFLKGGSSLLPGAKAPKGHFYGILPYLTLPYLTEIHYL